MIYRPQQLYLFVVFVFVWNVTSHRILTYINVKPKEQSRMDNPENLATLGTQDEDKQNKKHYTESLKDEQHGLHPKLESNPGAHEE